MSNITEEISEFVSEETDFKTIKAEIRRLLDDMTEAEQAGILWEAFRDGVDLGGHDYLQWLAGAEPDDYTADDVIAYIEALASHYPDGTRHIDTDSGSRTTQLWEKGKSFPGIFDGLKTLVERRADDRGFLEDLAQRYEALPSPYDEGMALMLALEGLLSTSSVPDSILHTLASLHIARTNRLSVLETTSREWALDIWPESVWLEAVKEAIVEGDATIEASTQLKELKGALSIEELMDVVGRYKVVSPSTKEIESLNTVNALEVMVPEESERRAELFEKLEPLIVGVEEWPENERDDGRWPLLIQFLSYLLVARKLDETPPPSIDPILCQFLESYRATSYARERFQDLLIEGLRAIPESRREAFLLHTEQLPFSLVPACPTLPVMRHVLNTGVEAALDTTFILASEALDEMIRAIDALVDGGPSAMEALGKILLSGECSIEAEDETTVWTPAIAVTAYLECCRQQDKTPPEAIDEVVRKTLENHSVPSPLGDRWEVHRRMMESLTVIPTTRLEAIFMEAESYPLHLAGAANSEAVVDDAAPLLSQVMESGDGSWELEVMGRRGVPFYRRALRIAEDSIAGEASFETKRKIYELVGGLGTDEAPAMVAQGLYDSNPTIRVVAAQELMRFAAGTIVDVLPPVLNHRKKAIRLGAARLLRRLSPDPGAHQLAQQRLKNEKVGEIKAELEAVEAGDEPAPGEDRYPVIDIDTLWDLRDRDTSVDDFVEALGEEACQNPDLLYRFALAANQTFYSPDLPTTAKIVAELLEHQRGRRAALRRAVAVVEQLPANQLSTTRNRQSFFVHGANEYLDHLAEKIDGVPTMLAHLTGTGTFIKTGEYDGFRDADALEWLKKNDLQAGQSAYLRCLSHPRRLERQTAIGALIALGAEVIPEMGSILLAETTPVDGRISAAEALEKLEDPEAIEYLEEALENESTKRAKKAIRHALDTLDEASAPEPTRPLSERVREWIRRMKAHPRVEVVDNVTPEGASIEKWKPFLPTDMYEFFDKCQGLTMEYRLREPADGGGPKSGGGSAKGGVRFSILARRRNDEFRPFDPVERRYQFKYAPARNDTSNRGHHLSYKPSLPEEYAFDPDGKLLFFFGDPYDWGIIMAGQSEDARFYVRHNNGSVYYLGDSFTQIMEKGLQAYFGPGWIKCHTSSRRATIELNNRATDALEDLYDERDIFRIEVEAYEEMSHREFHRFLLEDGDICRTTDRPPEKASPRFFTDGKPNFDFVMEIMGRVERVETTDYDERIEIMLDLLESPKNMYAKEVKQVMRVFRSGPFLYPSKTTKKKAGKFLRWDLPAPYRVELKITYLRENGDEIYFSPYSCPELFREVSPDYDRDTPLFDASKHVDSNHWTVTLILEEEDVRPFASAREWTSQWIPMARS